MAATAVDWERWRDMVAELAVRNSIALDLFQRLEVEAEEARARQNPDPLEAARALLRARDRKGGLTASWGLPSAADA
ncbi:hypothetical protein LAZ40_13205 [Cereibacter sphaeroides]|uniref:hypothetical protein n=1 Tax=Cereibacter sphaeroides TaxID=1063 RepID=UPI001F45583B|nr:hypothetical protein [Cereibacter sphaeroides]MCE6959979.1 hypothetical protein [Cereibacter sphaeroides]MCE6973064.1 hypothetical protein [Cereibacter sphaeroides]